MSDVNQLLNSTTIAIFIVQCQKHRVAIASYIYILISCLCVQFCFIRLCASSTFDEHTRNINFECVKAVHITVLYVTKIGRRIFNDSLNVMFHCEIKRNESIFENNMRDYRWISFNYFHSFHSRRNYSLANSAN